MPVAASTAQWSEALATSSVLTAAYLVANGDGYSFSTTGPATGWLVPDGSDLNIEVTATGAKRLAMNANNEVLIYG